MDWFIKSSKEKTNLINLYKKILNEKSIKDVLFYFNYNVEWQGDEIYLTNFNNEIYEIKYKKLKYRLTKKEYEELTELYYQKVTLPKELEDEKKIKEIEKEIEQFLNQEKNNV